MVSSLLVDEGEFRKFLMWLPPLQEDEAYEIILMIRSTGLRDVYGFKGSDHKLASKLVHGYLSEKIPRVPGLQFRNIEHWRLRLYEDVKKLAVEAVQADWFYIKYKAGTREVEEVYKIPYQLMALYISINPSKVMRASLSTVKDVLESTWTMAESRNTILKEIYRRPDERYHANAMKHTRTRFHTIDVDEKELGDRILKLVSETFGHTPPTIMTKRGLHILVNLEKLTEEKLIHKWVGKQDKNILPVIERYKKLSKAGTRQREVEVLREKLEDYIWNSNDPLFHRMKVASILYVNERGGSIVEVKKKPIEPIPGTYYKGIIARIHLPT